MRARLKLDTTKCFPCETRIASLIQLIYFSYVYSFDKSTNCARDKFIPISLRYRRVTYTVRVYNIINYLPSVQTQHIMCTVHSFLHLSLMQQVPMDNYCT